MAPAETTPYEREHYCAYLVDQAKACLRESETSYGDTAREAKMPVVMPGGDPKIKWVIEQAWLRDSANRVKSDIMRMWRAEGFYKFALKADPTFVIRDTETDYLQELNKIALRRQHLYAELTERLRFQDFRLRQ